MRPSVVLIFDGVRQEIILATPERDGAAAAIRSAGRDRGAPGRPPTCGPAHQRRPREDRVRLEHREVALSGNGRDGEILHSRRGHLPGCAEPALFGALRPLALRVLPGAAPPQPVAVHVLREFRRLPGQRIQPRNPRPTAGWHGDGPTDRRHPAPRRHAGSRRRQRSGAAIRPERTRRASDAARPRAQRCRPRVPAQHG